MAVTSLKANLFLNIQSRMAVEVPEVVHCDLDFGQIDYQQKEANRYPVKLPGVLFDFIQLERFQKQGYQHVKGVCRMKLATEKWEHTSEEQLLATREQALQYFELEHKLYTKFQYWDGGGLLNKIPFYAVNEQVEKRELDGLRVVIIDFRFEYDDDSAG